MISKLFTLRSFLFPLFFLSTQLLLAQAPTIRGTVRDEQDQPLPGVNIVIKGTGTPDRTNGSLTNANGAFSLAPTRALTTRDVLVFSFIGYATTEVPFTGQTVLNLQLKAGDQMLNEVIVTALGIQREEKSLGFAAQTVNENAVKDAKSNNWLNTLSGKVAGLNI